MKNNSTDNNMNEETSFADRLSDFMNTRSDNFKMTARELSEITGISTAMFSDYRNNKSNPTSTNIVKIAKALNVSADYLLGISQDEAGDTSDEALEKRFGLNSTAITELQKLKDDVSYYPRNDYKFSLIDCLNMILSDPNFNRAMHELREVLHTIAIFDTDNTNAFIFQGITVDGKNEVDFSDLSLVQIFLRIVEDNWNDANGVIQIKPVDHLINYQVMQVKELMAKAIDKIFNAVKSEQPRVQRSQKAQLRETLISVGGDIDKVDEYINKLYPKANDEQ